MTGAQIDAHIVKAVAALESIAGSLEGIGFPERVVYAGERRWYCESDNEFGEAGYKHPYCLAGTSYRHAKCGWGTWTREAT